MSNAISFGVVMPAFNAARFLPRSLGSVRRQTLAPARILVVDDGSHDGTAEIAEQLGAEVIRQANAGPSRARNVAAAALNTEWLAFLDADDAWESAALERIAQAIRLCPDVQVVFGDYAIEEPGGAVSSWFEHDANYAAVERRRVAPGIVRCARPSLVAALVRSLAFVSTSSLAIRRDAFLNAGGFDESLLVAEDLDLLLRLFNQSTAVAVEEVLSTYVRHGKNLSDDAATNIDWLARLLERVGAHPERYPADASALLAAQRPARLAQAGAFALRSGRFGEARAWFERSWTAGASVRAAAGIAAATALDNPPGRRIHGALRSVWRERRRAAG